MLAVLVFVHELGHFSVAKWFKIRVDEFAIGFPPRLFGFKKGETEYTVNLIPFGGFVKIFGENPDEGSVTGVDSARAFGNQHRLVQAAVLLAGVTMNIVFAWFLFSVAFIGGVPTLQEEAPRGSLIDTHVVIGGVLPNSPAALSGLLSGDRVVSLTTAHDTLTATDSYEAVQTFIQTHAEPINITILRGKETKTISVTPETGISADKQAIGVVLASVGMLKLGVGAAFLKGISTTYEATINTAVGLFSFVTGLFSGATSIQDVSGPVGIANLVGQARVFGFTYLLTFAAYISINLAVINVLPFPALDGGRLLFVAIEGIIRRPVNQKLFNWTNGLGFVLLISLLLFVTYHDVLKLF